MHTRGLHTYRRHLPHWRLPGSVYHVTWSLRRNQPDLSPPERSLVMSAIKNFEPERYDLYAFAVMNDHAHVLVAVREGFPLEHTIASWKSYTTHRMQRDFGRKGSVWVDEYFDRIIRCRTDYAEKVDYILSNPARRWPGIARYPWCGLGAAGRREIRLR